MCPDWESNQRPFAPQDDAQASEPHQSGQHQKKIFLKDVEQLTESQEELENQLEYKLPNIIPWN